MIDKFMRNEGESLCGAGFLFFIVDARFCRFAEDSWYLKMDNS